LTTDLHAWSQPLNKWPQMAWLIDWLIDWLMFNDNLSSISAISWLEDHMCKWKMTFIRTTIAFYHLSWFVSLVDL
jgi:hypothetical protein